MVWGILFDLGGTLDGDGLHWLDRFLALYRDAGVTLPRETLRAAFDAAEACAAGDEAIATAGLDEMIGRHVDWQLEHLAPRLPPADASGLRSRLVSGFITPIRATAAANRILLDELATRGFALGVVSNGCGNVETLCREYGYAPFLSTVIDSRRVGVSKPDPRIFTLAAERLGVPAAHTLVVGDSFGRDVVPATRAGMTAAWLQPDATAVAPDPNVPHLRFTRLGELGAWLAAPATAR